MREERIDLLRTSLEDLAEQLASGTHLGVNAAAVMVRLQAAATARLGAVLDLVPNGPLPAASTLRFQFDASVGEQLTALGEIAPDGDATARKRARTDRPTDRAQGLGHEAGQRD